MQTPSPVGANVPSVVVPPMQQWVTDTRYRAVAPATVVLTAALQSVGMPIIVPAKSTTPILFRYRLFLAGAAAAVTGVQFQIIGPGGSFPATLSWGPSTAVNVLRFDNTVATLSPTYLAFDISAIGSCIVIDGGVQGIAGTGIIDLQMKLAGAGVYNLSAGSYVEAFMGT